jgi:hypothetical protein
MPVFHPHLMSIHVRAVLIHEQVRFVHGLVVYPFAPDLARREQTTDEVKDATSPKAIRAQV